MAARTNRIVHDENTRSKIQTSQIINRLTGHVLGEVEMTASQVTAALGLIRKTLPDLQAVEMQTEVTERRVISAEPMKLDDWEQQYSRNLEPSEGASESAD